MASITAFNSLFRGLAVEEVSQVRRTKAQILAKLDVRQAFVSASPGSLIYPRARNSERCGYFSHSQQRLFSPCGEDLSLGAGLGLAARYREKIIPETNHGVLRIQFLTRRARAMSSVGRWVLTYTELEAVVHGALLEFQLEGLSFQSCFMGRSLVFPVIFGVLD